jgi:hypothetical protein
LEKVSDLVFVGNDALESWTAFELNGLLHAHDVGVDGVHSGDALSKLPQQVEIIVLDHFQPELIPALRFYY